VAVLIGGESAEIHDSCLEFFLGGDVGDLGQQLLLVLLDLAVACRELTLQLGVEGLQQNVRRVQSVDSGCSGLLVRLTHALVYLRGCVLAALQHLREDITIELRRLVLQKLLAHLANELLETLGAA